MTPQHQQENVRLNQPIQIYFNEPLDPSTVNESNIWLIKDTVVGRVAGTIQYIPHSGSFCIQFTPTTALEPQTTYRVAVRGESRGSVSTNVMGIRTASGSGMSGDYDWTFTTGVAVYLPKIVLSYPGNKISYIGGTPPFVWQTVAGASVYEIAIATTPSFENPVYSNNTIGGVSITLDIPLSDMQEYWWKVRAIDSSGNLGEWSDIWSYYNGNLNQGVISSEDTPLGDYPLVELYNTTTVPTVTNTMPPNQMLNVNINLEISFYQ